MNSGFEFECELHHSRRGVVSQLSCQPEVANGVWRAASRGLHHSGRFDRLIDQIIDRLGQGKSGFVGRSNVNDGVTRRLSPVLHHFRQRNALSAYPQVVNELRKLA